MKTKFKNITFIAVVSLLFLFTACNKDDDNTTTTEEPSTGDCTTEGRVDQSTNSEIETIRQAMVSFRSSLSSDLLDQGSTCLDNERMYLWAEFNTEGSTGANQGTIADYNHIHTITRIPNNPTTDNGGDNGIFAQIINGNGVKTLHEHYALADHHSKSLMKFDYTVKGIHAHDEHSHGHGHSHTHNM